MELRGGVAYGYSLPVGHRFNVDFTLGIGYLGGLYKEYILWTVTMYGRPLKTPLVRPDQGGYLFGVVDRAGEL